MAVSTSSARWRAIVNRDATANDFVYGVRTTKIYCRPRCPARLARRANVEFYDTPKQAEKAGYRPCKRCKPEDLRAPPDPHIKLAQRACETMTLAALACSNGETRQRPTLQDLANEAGLTPSHFHRVFKKVVGITPGRFAREVMEGKKMVGYLKRLEEGISASGAGYAGYGGGAGACGVDRDAVDEEGETSEDVAMDLSSRIPGGNIGGAAATVAAAAAAAAGLGLDAVDGALSPATGGGSENYAGLPDAGAIRIDWNEFDRMLSGGGDAGRQSNNSNNSNNHHNHNTGFCIAGESSQAQRFQTSPATTGASLYPHILDPSSTNTAGLLLDHYELPWESSDCTLNFSSPPIHHATTTTTNAGDSYAPYNSFMKNTTTNQNASTDFYNKFFENNNNNHNSNNNCNNCSSISSAGNGSTSGKPPHLDLFSVPSEESLTPVDTPPFHVDSLTGFSSGSSASSANASPLLFEDVDWYGSPSIFQTYA
ncbi:hypothetical protein AJ79_02144 [Helicocarpus griseus UAMH5409]|uniref:HTH araC/xylS-type domain-containing protein n=1 Tax=Helicocarpus griseus UAMH5409 TaxID=1447875 RepID=A0A2B7XVH2_9EURO|nr:hypothetical protein AJ79_02144 [Helicocarpus griseus UAMH5409]